MKISSILLLASGLLFSAGCKHDADLACPDEVVGTWRLVSRQSDGAQPAVLPQEKLVIKENGEFTFFTNERPSRNGRYSLTQGATICGVPGTRPGIYFDSGARPAGVAYTVADCKLTLDYGGPCDAPVDT